jgi:hypothetical protein
MVSWIFTEQFGFPDWAFTPYPNNSVGLVLTLLTGFTAGGFPVLELRCQFWYFEATGFHACNNNKNIPVIFPKEGIFVFISFYCHY